jgi:hypothetical protein
MKSIFGSELKVLPEEFSSIQTGSQWCWEPLKIESRCYIEVVCVERKPDGNWWVLVVAIRDGGGVAKGRQSWNELSRFVEAAVLTKAAGG